MTNLAFTALIKSKGYNKKRLAAECKLSPTQMSNRINRENGWQWSEVCTVCAALGITYDEFATYFPVVDVRKSTAAPAISQADLAALKTLRSALTTILKGA